MRLLLIEKTGVFIQNGKDSVSFADLNELKRYTNVDLVSLVGEKRVGYEPDRGIHTEFDGVDTITKGAFTPYDNLIKNVNLFKARKENPFYGLSGKELFEAQKKVDETAVRATFEVEANAPVQALGFTWKGGESSAGAINGAVVLAQALGETEANITDIDNVAHTMSFADTLFVAAQIGKAWRDAFFKKQAALVEIANRVMS